MAIDHFIPEIWNANILENFRQTAIFAGLANREYEGDATKGNTVHITGVVDVEVKDYKAANRTTTADDITDTGIDLLIDQEKNFDFYVDDIDRAQAAGSLDAYGRSAANGLVTDADQFLAALLIAGGIAVTPGAPATDAASAWNVFRDLRKVLNKNLVPQGSRVACINAEFAALLEEHDSKLMKVNESGTTSGLRDAASGRILGIDVYTSENLPETDKPQIVAWHRPTLAYVSQIQETEALRAQNKFADRLRGLHVYGAKIVRPTSAVHWTAA
jgi:hypothetical protein